MMDRQLFWSDGFLAKEFVPYGRVMPYVSYRVAMLICCRNSTTLIKSKKQLLEASMEINIQRRRQDFVLS